MNFNRLTRMAVVSAVALGAAAYSGSAWAAAYELDSGVAVNVPVTAHVLQTVDVTVTQDIDFKDIGIHQDKVGADTATSTMTPAGVVSEDAGVAEGDARFVTDSGDVPEPAIITLTGAFPTTNIHVDYVLNTSLTCAACGAGTPVLTLTNVADNLSAAPGPAVGTGVQGGNFATNGIGTTTAGGALTWNIGATLTTVASANDYETGNYNGSFDMYLSY